MAVAKTKTAKAAAKPAKKKVARSKASTKTTTTAKPRARRTVKKAKAVSPSANSESVRHEIELLAYKLWEERGCPEGSGLEDWAQAEQQLMG